MEILAVAPDDRERQQAMIDRINGTEGGPTPDFRMLHDADLRVIDRYGVRNVEGYRDYEVPHPATFVIDRDGIVRWKVIETNFRLRPEPEDLIAALLWARGEGPEPEPPTLTNVRER